MKHLTKIIFLTIASYMLMSCGSVPLTGRKQLLLVPDTEINQASAMQYKQFVGKHPKSNDRRKTDQVIRVGRKIASAAETYLKDNGLAKEVENFKWEFNVIEDKQVNAFCMPGGKIVVYTGLLPLCANDAELATVMAHEVSHALAKHSAERVSQQMLRQLGGQVLGMAVGQRSQVLQQTIGMAYGLGSELFIALPYSRKHEYEADHIGLFLMALAGYNPHSAVEFWKKMAANSGEKPSEFLSTHPSDENRILKLQEAMPKAMKYYEKKRK